MGKHTHYFPFLKKSTFQPRRLEYVVVGGPGLGGEVVAGVAAAAAKELGAEPF